jgi:hypothetical protein
LLVTKIAAFLLPLILIAPLYAQSTGGFGASSNLSVYDGPAMLGRGGGTVGKRGADPTPIRVFASVNGTYDTNMLGASVDSAGNFVSRPTYGANIGFGASGQKIWRRSMLGLEYSGDYGYYRPQNLYNGTNQQLNFTAGTQIGRSWQLNTQVGAGTSNRFLGGQSIFQASEIEFLSAPTLELFNSRSYFIGTSAGATYTFDRRKSVRISGFGSSVKRVSSALIDMQSYGASADYVHRINRTTSAGFSYTFSHYDFKKVFGESDIHTVGGHMSRKFGRAWELAGSLTVSRQSTVGVRTVALDPVIAAILGRSTGAEVFESNNLLYGYSASITRAVRRSSASLHASRGITPGNGYFLTSINQSFGANLTHELSRELSVSASFGYSKLVSLGFASGNFQGWYGGTSLGYKVSNSVGLNAGYDWRSYDLQQTTFGRTGHRVTIGISYHPQGGPAGLF